MNNTIKIYTNKYIAFELVVEMKIPDIPLTYA